MTETTERGLKSIAEEVAARPVWEISASMYQARMGVHQPWICEISPYQYGSMSKRGKAQYDAKRSQEWAASGAVKQGWHRKVIVAYEAGEVTLDTPGLHSEAKSAIIHEQIRRREVETERRYKEALKQNRITGPGEIKKGDTVFDVICGKYGEVVKVNKKTARVWIDFAWGGRDVKVDIRLLQWKHPNDIRAEIEKVTA